MMKHSRPGVNGNISAFVDDVSLMSRSLAPNTEMGRDAPPLDPICVRSGWQLAVREQTFELSVQVERAFPALVERDLSSPHGAQPLSRLTSDRQLELSCLQ
jgi:hypothetical protein